jgi:hypothetical protein
MRMALIKRQGLFIIKDYTASVQVFGFYLEFFSYALSIITKAYIVKNSNKTTWRILTFFNSYHF